MSKLERPICVAHRCPMIPARNGYRVLINADFGPYEVHAGDMYECPQGGEQIVIGWASRAVSMHFEPDFEQYAKSVDLEIPA